MDLEGRLREVLEGHSPRSVSKLLRKIARDYDEKSPRKRETLRYASPDQYRTVSYVEEVDPEELTPELVEECLHQAIFWDNAQLAQTIVKKSEKITQIAWGTIGEPTTWLRRSLQQESYSVAHLLLKSIPKVGWLKLGVPSSRKDYLKVLFGAIENPKTPIYLVERFVRRGLRRHDLGEFLAQIEQRRENRGSLLIREEVEQILLWRYEELREEDS